MSTTEEARESAIAATDETCPRCGAPRTPDQEYCVECGLRLPDVRGTVPSLRRRWVRRLGWYPGDWVWTSVLTLVIAAAGAAVSIAVTTKERENTGSTFVAPSTAASVHEPTTPTARPTTANTATLPTAPEPTVTKKPTGPPPPPPGRTVWPANRNGWTIVLISYPTAGGRTAALSTATRAAKAGLPEVGVLESARFASLHPGYFVVFSGIYRSKTAADAGLRTARASGFAGAYSRPVSR